MAQSMINIRMDTDEKNSFENVCDQLDLCARSHFIGQKRIQKDFSSKEANLLKVLQIIYDKLQKITK